MRHTLYRDVWDRIAPQRRLQRALEQKAMAERAKASVDEETTRLSRALRVHIRVTEQKVKGLQEALAAEEVKTATARDNLSACRCLHVAIERKQESTIQALRIILHSTRDDLDIAKAQVSAARDLAQSLNNMGGGALGLCGQRAVLTALDLALVNAQSEKAKS